MTDESVIRALVKLLREHQPVLVSRWLEAVEQHLDFRVPAMSVSKEYYTRWIFILFRLILRQMERPDSQALVSFIRRFVNRGSDTQFPINTVFSGLIALKRTIIGLLIQLYRDTPDQLKLMCDAVESKTDETRTLVFDLYVEAKERQIREHEQYLQSIISGSADAIITMDERLVIRSWNRGAETIYGYTAEEMIGQPFIKLVPEELQQQGELERIIERIRNEGYVQGYETVRMAKGGRRVHVEFTATALVDEQGNPTGSISSIIRDVTRRVELERELRQTKDYLEGVINSSTDAITATDLEGRVTFFSKGAERLFRHTPDEILGQPAARYFARGDEEVQKVISLLQRGEGRLEEYETEIVTKYGDVIPVSLSVSFLYHQGTITGTVEVCRNITERKELEQRLERKVAGLSIINEIGRMLQRTTDPEEILYTVLIGATAGQGLKFNRAFLLLLNQEQHCLEGRLAIGPSSPEEAGRIWATLSRRGVFTLEDILRSCRAAASMHDIRVNEIVRQLRIPLTDESHILVQTLLRRHPINVADARNAPGVPPDFLNLIGSNVFAAIPLISQEQSVGVLLVDNMITGKPILDEDVELLEIFAYQASATIEKAHLYRELEQQLRALEQANADLKAYQEKLIQAERLSAVGMIAATVAHEIRNPLVSIGGFARALLRKTPPDSPHREYLEIIVKEGIRLEEIVTKVLDLARPLQLQAEPHEINQLIREELMVVSEDIQSKQIRVDQRLQSDLPPVPVDADQMKQVFLNLFKNAIYAIPHGGRLRVWTTTTNHAFIEIGIADTGTGIPEEHLEKVFNPFFTTKPGGSGLGLAVASRIIHDHGGTIRVESTVGRGTTFYIRLPLRREEFNVSTLAR